MQKLKQECKVLVGNEGVTATIGKADFCRPETNCFMTD